jgi:hypothetical protein
MNLFHNKNVDNSFIGRVFKFQLWTPYSFGFVN